MDSLLFQSADAPWVYLIEKDHAREPAWWVDAVTEGGTRLPALVLAECRDPGIVRAEVPLHYAMAKLLCHFGCRVALDGGLALITHPRRNVWYSAAGYGCMGGSSDIDL